MKTKTRAALAATAALVAVGGGLLAVDISQQRHSETTASRCQPVERAPLGTRAVDTETGVIFDASGDRFFTDDAAQMSWYGGDLEAERTYCVASVKHTVNGLERVWLEGVDEWGAANHLTPDVKGLDYCGARLCGMQVI